jgi:O-antigen chain-terminating methyltransferase
VGSAAQADGAVSMTDPIYVEFENLFRGDRADIKRRFEVYVPRLKDAKLGQPDMPVLDLGCGRGEWLELLRDEGLAGSGVDTNLVMIEECRGLGLSVTAGNAIHHLRSLPAASLGAVTGFHIVEHLPLDDLLALLDETNRVLRPGGMAIFETPNPSNILVSTENFYMDPTHRNPLPQALLKFLLEARGLCDIEVLPLHPYPASYRLEDDGRPATRLLNQLFFSEQDYAVIGRKV